MTVIVAARLKGGGVALAADSQWTAGWRKGTTDAKIWTAGSYIVGAAGGMREAQIVRHFTTWPKHRPDEDTDTEAFAVKQIVPALRTAVADKGVLVNSSGLERVSVELLTAWDDNIVTIHDNFCIGVEPDRYAIGSGADEALGALGDKGPWTLAQVVEAARRATITNLGCGGTIHYATTKHPTVKAYTPTTERTA